MLEESKLKEEMENAINWVRDFVNESRARGIVVGNSGGKDSAVVIGIAVKAIRKRQCNSSLDAM